MSEREEWEYVRVARYDGHSIRNDLYHKPEEPASYIIWKDGPTIYAKDGHTGQIPFKGKDAATVIQQAICPILADEYLYAVAYTTFTRRLKLLKISWRLRVK